ncbi:hypothetical protein HanIR_Chr14g0675521 [Helianthus annuus]|nr:hypothetical protein HanIR_Chr14g0675521 [Helianthus annuus]
MLESKDWKIVLDMSQLKMYTRCTRMKYHQNIKYEMHLKLERNGSSITLSA